MNLDVLIDSDKSINFIIKYEYQDNKYIDI